MQSNIIMRSKYILKMSLKNLLLRIPKSRSYFRHLMEPLESFEQENGVNEVERREDPQVYGHGKGYRYLRQYKLNF